MERDGQQGDQDGRGFLTLALAALIGATGAAFGRVFEDSGVASQLVLAGAVAVALAALLERRSLLLSLLASAAALLVLLGLAVFPRTTWVVFPTAETLEALGRALGNLGRQAVEQPAPAPAIPSLLSASIIAVWSAAYAAHALAARAGSPILALAPPVTLLAFAEVVMEDGPRPGYAAAFLVAAVLVLFSSGIRGLRGWGPLLPRRSFAAARMATGPMGRAAQLMGITATAVALTAPGVLPGFGAAALVDIGGAGRSRVAISPLVDIRPNLQRDEPVELFLVRAAEPSYWRLLSLDTYNGRVWSASDPQATGGVEIPGAAVLPVANAGGEVLDQEFELTNLGGTWLPAASRPVAVEAETDLRFDGDAASLVAPDGIPADLDYLVRSELVVPTPEELDRPVDYATAGLADRYFQLPTETPPGVRAYAIEVTRGARTPYRKALAIQNHLRSFVYDDEVPAGHGIDDLRFFLRAKRGYCEQFAGTMAVLLRSLGLPSRVVVGFLPGEEAEGAWHVTTEEAHSWVEMYFPGHGWLAFEPTPTRSNPVSSPYLSSTIGTVSSGAPAVGEAAIVGRQGIAGLDVRLSQIERQLGGLRGAAAGDPEEAPGGGHWPIVWASGGALLLVALVVPPLARAGGRRRRLRRAATARERVLAAYAGFQDRARDLGLGRRPGETPAEYERRLTAELEAGGEDLGRLTRLATRALYTGRATRSEEAAAAVEAMDGLRGVLRRHVGLARSLAAWVRPAPAPLR